MDSTRDFLDGQDFPPESSKSDFLNILHVFRINLLITL